MPRITSQREERKSTHTAGMSTRKSTIPALNPGFDAAAMAGGEIWVKKWVDYSSKYGLGYILTSKATGVFFNDSTKII
jgi:polo-like kinase 1